MGVYLSSPVTEKDSIDEQCDGFIYGASSMQGWRTTQEDAHNCIPVFDDKTKTSFFAVYDGHGGSEVAKYCEGHFPDFVKKMMEAQGGIGDDPSEFIQNAFLAFDATLTSEEVIKELKVLAGKDDDNEEDEDDDPVGRSETDMLKEEADMPLDQLLAQYKSGSPEEVKNVRKQENFQSPALKAKVGGSTSDEGISSQDAENGPSSSSSISISSLSSPSSSSCQQDNVDSSTVTNGVKNSNNSNSTNQSQTQDDNDNVTIDNGDQENRPSNNNNVVDKVTTTSNSNNLTATEPSDAVSSSTSSSKKKKAKSHVDKSSNEATPGGSQSATSSNSCSSSSSASQPGGSSSGTVTSTDSNDEPSGSGTGRHSGVRSSKAKAAVDMAMVDGAMDTSDDDEDDEEEEDAWEDMSDDDDDDEEEDDHDEDVPMMDMTNEEPGSDSGCTACVVLMQGKKIIVANAGDSRCILSRAGKAVELSFDHKPEDDTEKERIEKAGGKVTADGRVNGGLNLSRAIGDHVYKRNKDLPDREQMITALPDIETAELCDEDQFIVIACDGIWNYMSSQEVVNYVTEKLKDPERRQAPSIVCEELFDHCLAPNTFGDGTGCDNMTCIIIVLDTFRSTETRPDKQGAAATADAQDSVDEEENSGQSSQSRSNEEDSGLVSGALKRCSDNVEVSEGKRLKLEEEVA